jgi:NADH peroxidase
LYNNTIEIIRENFNINLGGKYMKYVVVGTSHFGYEAVQTILKNEPNAEIHLYERGAGASFMG